MQLLQLAISLVFGVLIDLNMALTAPACAATSTGCSASCTPTGNDPRLAPAAGFNNTDPK